MRYPSAHIADEHNRGNYGKKPQTRTTSQNGSPSDNPPQGCNAKDGSRSQDGDSRYSPSQDRRAEDGGTQNPERPAAQGSGERHAGTAVHGTKTGGVSVRGHAATGTAVGRAVSQI